MKFEFLALVCGGRGDKTFDKEIIVSGENWDLRKALDAVYEQCADLVDFSVVSIEQVD